MRIRAITFLLVASAAAGSGIAQTTAPTVLEARLGGSSGGPERASSVEADLRALAVTLVEEGVPQPRRDEAARRLVSRHSPLARDLTLAALQDKAHRPAQLAAARALAADPILEPTFIAPLSALISNDRPLTDAAANALAPHAVVPGAAGEGVVIHLLAFLQDPARPEPCRASVARALGAVPDRRVAEALVKVVTGPAEAELLRAAADEALAGLAGRPPARAAGWAAWWDESAALSPEEFRRTLITARAARLATSDARYAALADETIGLLVEGHRLFPEGRRAANLQQLLTSPHPPIRIAGIRIVRLDAVEARAVPPTSRDRVRQMIGDPAAAVRTEVALTLRALNDADSLEGLLTQLAQEPDPSARAAIAGALGPIRDVRAVRPLLGLLQDNDPRVIEAATEALTELGAEVRRDATLTADVIAALQAILNDRAADPGRARLRAAAVDAMAPLARRDLLPVIQRLLAATEPPRVRRAALRFLAALHAPDTAPMILAALASDDPGIRLEAVTALGAIPTFDHAEALFRLLSPQAEPDAAVRARADSALAELFPFATRDSLATWAERLRGDPDRRLLVLQALAAKLAAPGDEDEQATVLQEIGETLLALDRPSEAIVPLRQAWIAANSARGSTRPSQALHSHLLEALLQAGQYADAISVAGRTLADDPTALPVLSKRLNEEVERLAARGDPDLLPFLNGVLALRPGLPEPYLRPLRAMHARLAPATTRAATRPAGQ